MTQEEKKISEGNLIISKYRGAKLVETYLNEKKEVDHYLMDFGQKEDYPDNGRYYKIGATTTMKYHESFNWIMPVINDMLKIKAPGFNNPFKLHITNEYVWIHTSKEVERADGRGPYTKDLYAGSCHLNEPVQENPEYEPWTTEPVTIIEKALWVVALEFINWLECEELYK